MLNHELYEYSLNNYLNAYPESDEYEYIIGNLFGLRMSRLNILRISDYRLQEMYFEQNKKDIDPDYSIILKWGEKYKKKETERLDRKIKFYQVRQRRLNIQNNPQESISQTLDAQKLNWSGTQLELTELLKALTKSNCFVDHSDKEVFEKIFNFLRVEYSENIHRDRVKTVKNRIKDLTPFLDRLYTHLTNWINSKDR